MRRYEVLVLVVLLIAAPAASETVTIEASRDATLIEHPEGAQANGSGPSFFVGRTSQSENRLRRGLLVFDVAAAVPENALLEQARDDAAEILRSDGELAHPEHRGLRLALSQRYAGMLELMDVA